MIGFTAHVGNLAGLLDNGTEEVVEDQSFDQLRHLWNDDKSMQLYETVEMYLDRLTNGEDCEQEFSDSMCLLAAFILQKEYKEKWWEYADPALLERYDAITVRSIFSYIPGGDESKEPSSGG